MLFVYRPHYIVVHLYMYMCIYSVHVHNSVWVGICVSLYIDLLKEIEASSADYKAKVNGIVTVLIPTTFLLLQCLCWHIQCIFMYVNS